MHVCTCLPSTICTRTRARVCFRGGSRVGEEGVRNGQSKEGKKEGKRERKRERGKEGSKSPRVCVCVDVTCFVHRAMEA